MNQITTQTLIVAAGPFIWQFLLSGYSTIGNDLFLFFTLAIIVLAAA